jgi:predicted nucleotide-binding protein (sugar kinase/HSP70/actin superfamily)
MGSYHIPIKYLIKNITKCKVLVPPKITKKTIALGSKYSPDYVCVPFKYNLGNFIESLEMGATTILQAGGGCRYGYYAELQEQILKDLNYDFEFINFIENNHVSIPNIYKYAKSLNKKLNIFTFSYYTINTLLIIIIMDKLSKYPRENMGFEIEKNSFSNTEKSLLKELDQPKHNPFSLIKIYYKYKKRYKQLKINKPKNCLKIGIVGELYSIMEPFCSNNIETKLASFGIEVHRFTTLTYLLFQKKYNIKHLLKRGKKYLKYHLGADATESVVLSLDLAKKNYDGIVHLKSFGCTPEINAMPILEIISNDYQIPIIYFSFDSQDSDVAIDTRLEAFYDMLLQKKEAVMKLDS